MRKQTGRAILLVGLVFAASLPAAAQNADHTRYLRAIAAGYKASFLCSDIFNAGMTEAQVEKDDLQRVDPELVPLMPAMKATIDRQTRMVSVPFDDTLPPRVAAWRPYLGCARSCRSEPDPEPPPRFRSSIQGPRALDGLPGRWVTAMRWQGPAGT